MLRALLSCPDIPRSATPLLRTACLFSCLGYSSLLGTKDWDFAALLRPACREEVRRVQAARTESGDREHQVFTSDLQAVVSTGHLLCGQRENGPHDSPSERWDAGSSTGRWKWTWQSWTGSFKSSCLKKVLVRHKNNCPRTREDR